MSAYSIDTDHQERLEKEIIGCLNAESVAKPLKAKLDELCQEALDRTTQYLSDEYVLVLTDIVRDRSKRLVQALLKGDRETAEYFALVAREQHWGPDKGKPFAYDPDGVRKAIVDAFKDEIANSEMISLQEDNDRLRQTLRIEREIRSRY